MIVSLINDFVALQVAKEVQLSRLTLPRKLRVLTAEVKGLEAQVKMTHKEDVSAGNHPSINCEL